MVVLVGYASEHGSTRGIAQRIAISLIERGHRVDVLAVDEVQAVDRYEAVVLGSAIHDQEWLPAAADFVRRNLGTLGGRPVWFFSVGMPAAVRGPLKRLAQKEEPKAVAELKSDLSPCDHRLFSGVVEADHLPVFGRVIFRVMGGRYGDFRAWEEIDGWADDIARSLTAG